jgi:hypothetical protein
MATSQSTTLKPTAFPEDIKVGKDVPKLSAMSSGILESGVGGENSCLGHRWLGCENHALRGKHRTEVTEVTEGDRGRW